MDDMRMIELSAQGFRCAQILMIHALESERKENPDLIRAAGGLGIGLSDTLGPCGALTGGCCYISYFAGKGDKDELEDPELKHMLSQFAAWFRQEYGSQICAQILDGNIDNMLSKCPGIVQAVHLKVTDILDSNGMI